jgi:hypothetical protein
MFLRHAGQRKFHGGRFGFGRYTERGVNGRKNFKEKATFFDALPRTARPLPWA